MQSIEEKVGMQLHLERVELAGRQGLLVFGPLQLLAPVPLQVIIGMRRQEGRHIDCDNVRKPIMNEQQRASDGASEKPLRGLVPQRKNQPANTGVAEQIRDRPETVNKQMPHSMPGPDVAAPHEVEDRRSEKCESQASCLRENQHLSVGRVKTHRLVENKVLPSC